MASATSTPKPWGYSVTGGTDATTILSSKAQIARVVCTGTASAGTITIADASGTTIVKPTLTTSLYEAIDLGGIRVEGIAVTLSATGTICNIVLV